VQRLRERTEACITLARPANSSGSDAEVPVAVHRRLHARVCSRGAVALGALVVVRANAAALHRAGLNER
jgi:hypothetical protein